MSEESQSSMCHSDSSHSTLDSSSCMQPWFPMALTMSIDCPRCLPHLDNLLEATANADPPNMPTQPNLVTWLISRNPCLTMLSLIQKQKSIVAHNRFLAKLQRFASDAMGLLIFLLKDLQAEKAVTKDKAVTAL